MAPSLPDTSKLLSCGIHRAPAFLLALPGSCSPWAPATSPTSLPLLPLISMPALPPTARLPILCPGFAYWDHGQRLGLHLHLSPSVPLSSRLGNSSKLLRVSAWMSHSVSNLVSEGKGTHIHSCIVHSSQRVEATQCLLMNEEAKCDAHTIDYSALKGRGF